MILLITHSPCPVYLFLPAPPWLHSSSRAFGESREAKSQIKLLDQLLHVKEPWDKEVDITRNR